MSDTAGSVTRARLSIAAINPPWVLSTAAITAIMPKIMIMPWMKSLMAVAMYPPAMTYTPVSTAITTTHTA